MLKIGNLAMTYDGAPLFDKISLVLNSGDRAGLVGPNGSGKSSLLKLLARLERPQSGSVQTSPDDRIGYLAQQVDVPDTTLGEYLRTALGDIYGLHLQMTALQADMADPEKFEKACHHYGEISQRFEQLGGWDFETKLETVRHQIGIAHLGEESQLRHLSGGEQSRVLMAGALLAEPTILLLDEPTNHLDASGIKWLADYLQEFKGAVLTVSHDRSFLNNLLMRANGDGTRRIYELDGIHDELQVYEGDYDAYRTEKNRRLVQLLADYEQQERDRNRREADILKMSEGAQQREASTRDSAQRRLAAKAAKKAKVRQRRLRREMEKAGWIARPETRPSIDLKMAGKSQAGQLVLSAQDITLSLPGRDAPVLSGLSLEVHGGERLRVTGENGSGKTTLLRALIGELSPSSGSVEVFTKISYLPQVHHGLPMNKSVLEYFRSQVVMYEEDARSWLHRFLFEQHQLAQPLGKLSAGERTRLLLAIMMLSGADLLILDEPTNNLDFDSLEVVEEALKEFCGTLVLVTHDQYFAEAVGVTSVAHLV
jgi:ATPase subunit of ABC transporter with duplicated ATPase domains